MPWKVTLGTWYWALLSEPYLISHSRNMVSDTLSYLDYGILILSVWASLIRCITFCLITYSFQYTIFVLMLCAWHSQSSLAECLGARKSPSRMDLTCSLGTQSGYCTILTIGSQILKFWCLINFHQVLEIKNVVHFSGHDMWLNLLKWYSTQGEQVSPIRNKLLQQWYRCNSHQ